MKNLKYRLSKGFTLIELMVVISIISLLSSIVLASVKEVREKARATKFRAEVDQFINALELYRADNKKKGGGTFGMVSWNKFYFN
jgi:general secretion pathway protein G